MKLLMPLVVAFVSVMFVGIGFSAATPINIWIPNYHSNLVTRLSNTGTILGTYAVTGGPQAIAVDSYGNVWVTTQSDTVVKLSSTGTTLGTYTVGRDPESIAADSSGDVWVADWGSGANGTIVKLSNSGSRLGTYVVGNYPQTLAIDSQGNVWVATNLGGVIKLSNSGAILGTYPLGNGPWGIAVAPNGNVWVSSILNNTVTEFSNSGARLGTYPTGSSPEDIAIDNSGNVWVTNFIDGTVSELSGVTGATLGTYSTGGEWPEAIAVDQVSGNIWVANYGGDSVTELSSNGITLEHFSGVTSTNGITISGPEGIAIGYQPYPPLPLSLTISPSTETITQGQSASFTATASGGSGQYTYTWIKFNLSNYGQFLNNNCWERPLPSGCASVISTSPEVIITPSSSMSLEAIVYDTITTNSLAQNVGIIVNTSQTTPLSMSVSSSPVSIVPGSTVNSGSVTSGMNITLTATASGGSGHYLYTWLLGGISNADCYTTHPVPSTCYNTVISTESTAIIAPTSTPTAYTAVVYDTSTGYFTAYFLNVTSNTAPNGVIFVGQNMTDGPWTVVLQDLGQPNANGIATASFNIYYNGTYVTATSMYPGYSSEGGVMKYGGSHYLFINLTSTFAGLYSYQKYAKFSLSTFNLTVSPSSTTISQGQNTTFTASASGGNGDYMYEWYNDSIGTPSPVGSEMQPYGGTTYGARGIIGGATGTFSYYVCVSSASGALLPNDPSVASICSIETPVTLTVNPTVNTTITTTISPWPQYNLTLSSSLTYNGWRITFDKVNANSSATFTVSYEGNYNVSPSDTLTINFDTASTASVGNREIDIGYTSLMGSSQSPQSPKISIELITYNNLQTTTTTIAPPPPTQQVTLNIKPGWNLLSSPDFNGDNYGMYDALQSSCGIANTGAMWGYNSSTDNYMTVDLPVVFENYEEYTAGSGSGFTIAGGYGFWFHSSKQCSITTQAVPISAVYQIASAAGTPLTENLNKGWNLIGTPFMITDSFNAIASSCNLRGGFYAYNATTDSYTTAATPAVGAGYFVYANAPCSLDWTPDISAGSPPSVP